MPDGGMDIISSASGRRKRILLVEDDPAVRRSLQLLFAANGYDVRAYASSDGLASDAAALQSACLVADLVLPGPDAIKLLDQLRAAGWRGKAVLISGQLNGESRALAKAAGFDSILAKPIVAGQLLGDVQRLVGKASEPATE